MSFGKELSPRNRQKEGFLLALPWSFSGVLPGASPWSEKTLGRAGKDCCFFSSRCWLHACCLYCETEASSVWRRQLLPVYQIWSLCFPQPGMCLFGFHWEMLKQASVTLLGFFPVHSYTVTPSPMAPRPPPPSSTLSLVPSTSCFIWSHHHPPGTVSSICSCSPFSYLWRPATSWAVPRMHINIPQCTRCPLPKQTKTDTAR